MGPHTLAYRAAVRVVVLAAAEKAANDPTFRPELADRLAELRPDVEEQQLFADYDIISPIGQWT